MGTRITGMRGYLCGAMDKADDCGIGWRQEIKKELKFLRITWLDPTNKPCDIGLEGKDEVAYGRKLITEGRYDEAAKMFREIRHIDLRLVDICDFVVVMIDLDVPSCGTWEELFWANRMLKPVLVVIKQGKAQAPSWLFGTIPHEMIFSTIEEVEEYLRHIAYGYDELTAMDKKRWTFFDFGR